MTDYFLPVYNASFNGQAAFLLQGLKNIPFIRQYASIHTAPHEQKNFLHREEVDVLERRNSSRNSLMAEIFAVLAGYCFK